MPGFLKGQCTTSTERNLYWKFNFEKDGSDSAYYATTSIGGDLNGEESFFSLMPASKLSSNIQFILGMCTLSNIAKLHIS